eukprot:scaffold260545_cov31-Prasinocladus_malaysianus.AAC.1
MPGFSLDGHDGCGRGGIHPAGSEDPLVACPHPDGLVKAAGDQHLAVGSPGDPRDGVVVAAEHRRQLPGARGAQCGGVVAPQTDHRVRRPRRKHRLWDKYT